MIPTKTGLDTNDVTIQPETSTTKRNNHSEFPFAKTRRKHHGMTKLLPRVEHWNSLPPAKMSKGGSIDVPPPPRCEVAAIIGVTSGRMVTVGAGVATCGGHLGVA